MKFFHWIIIIIYCAMLGRKIKQILLVQKNKSVNKTTTVSSKSFAIKKIINFNVTV